jgi:gluconokinase
MSTTRVVVLMGVAGTGKTTIGPLLAAGLGVPYAEGDDFHPPANIAKMTAGTPLDDEDRWPWLRALAEWIGRHEQEGRSAVVTCSALKRSYRDLLRDGHPSVWFAHVRAAPELIRDRVEHRTGHYMPPSLLDSQLATLERLGEDEPGDVIAGDAPLDQTVTAVLTDLRRERQLS